MNKRLAVIDPNKCKPTKCNHECKLICPVEKQGKECVDIEDIKTAKIVEPNCIGCNMCVQRCPFDAITIVNVPSEIGNFITHRYDKNGFRLYKIPTMKVGQVLGIIGANGSGKTSILNILSGKLIPNFENLIGKIKTTDILKKFKGNVLQKYFQQLYNKSLKIIHKNQHIYDYIKEQSVNDFLKDVDCNNSIINNLDLNHLMFKKMNHLSGGELQRVVCAKTILTDANVYIFDEPSNFLDVDQRIKLAQEIRNLIRFDRYIIIVEHDLSMLDYVADNISIVYGQSGVYGTSSMSHSTNDAINMYFDGYLVSENMRFRSYEYKLKEFSSDINNKIKNENNHTYPDTIIQYDGFCCKINSGSFSSKAAINVIVGRNGSGKTSYVNYISKFLEQQKCFSISVKKQDLNIDQFKLNDNTYPTVQSLLFDKIKIAMCNSTFEFDIIKKLQIDTIKDRKLNELSGGELQKLLIVLCLGTPSQIYFIDEPSACLDVEQRMLITKIIKKFIINNEKTAFIVEHDLLMIMALSCESTSHVIVTNQIATNHIENKHIKSYEISCPLTPSIGISMFLKDLNITIRTNSINSKYNRPRINKFESQKDKEQKSTEKYYL